MQSWLGQGSGKPCMPFRKMLEMQRVGSVPGNTLPWICRGSRKKYSISPMRRSVLPRVRRTEHPVSPWTPSRRRFCFLRSLIYKLPPTSSRAITQAPSSRQDLSSKSWAINQSSKAGAETTNPQWYQPSKKTTHAEARSTYRLHRLNCKE